MKRYLLLGLIFIFSITFSFSQRFQIDSTFGINGRAYSITPPNGLPISSKISLDKILVNISYQSATTFRGKFCYSIFDAQGKLFNDLGQDGVVLDSLTLDHVGFDGVMTKGGEVLQVGGIEFENSGAALVGKFNSAGIIDRSFGDNGFFLKKLDFISQAITIIMDEMESIYVGALSATNVSETSFIMKLTPSGAPDTSFNSSGYFVCNFNGEPKIRKIIFQEDGKLLAFCEQSFINATHILIFRLLTNGTLDTSFGDNGSISIPLRDIDTYAGDFVRLSNRRYAFNSIRNVFEPGETPLSDVYVIKENGELDTTFCTDCPQPGVSPIEGNLIESILPYRDKILLGGWIPDGDGNFSRIRIDRLSDDKLDVNFRAVNANFFESMKDSFYLTSYVLQDTSRVICLGLDRTVSKSYNATLLALKLDNSISNKKLETTTDDILLYPNPVDDILHLVLSNPEKSNPSIIVKVYTVEGKLIKTQACSVEDGELKVPIKLLPPGNYVGTINNGIAIQTFKFSKI